jgi:hypothetical protein
LFCVELKIIPPINIANILKKAGRELKRETSESPALSLLRKRPAKDVARFSAID